MKKKHSPIWNISKDSLQNIVKNCSTVSCVLLHFGLSNKGGNYKTLKSRLEADNIDFSHIQLGIGANKNKTWVTKTRTPFDQMFCKNSPFTRNSIRRRILIDKLIEQKCALCNLHNEWNNKILSLHLDHINGDGTDNRLNNLRFLCPNCHSQTDTYAGKKFKKYNLCPTCNCRIHHKSKMCRKCSSSIRNKKFETTKETLEILIKQKPIIQIAKMFNVSDNAIRKRCKILGINL